MKIILKFSVIALTQQEKLINQQKFWLWLMRDIMWIILTLIAIFSQWFMSICKIFMIKDDLMYNQTLKYKENFKNISQIPKSIVWLYTSIGGFRA